MKNIITLLVFTIAYIGHAQADLPFQLVKDWELADLDNPESVVLDTKNKVLYVSNVNGEPTHKDGNGYISKVSLDGKTIQQKWILGLNAPKGMAVHKGKLYVTDIDEIIEINIETKNKKSHKVQGATFLNDIAADKKGNIYVSNTFGFSAIYRLSKKGTPTVWLKDQALNMPNGLYISKNTLLVAGWGHSMDPKTYRTKINGQVLSIDLKTKKINTITAPIGNLDGLGKTLHGLLISDWLAGKLLYYSNKAQTVSEVLDLPQGSADLYFNKKTKAVYIPLMLDNKLLKYHFKKQGHENGK